MQDRSDGALRVTVSRIRRVLAVAVLMALAGLLGVLAFGQTPMAGFWRAALGVAGLALLGVAWQMWAVTARGLMLDGDVLAEAGGRVICRLDDIRRVESGALAFKPSSGFVLHLSASGRLAWRPGLWWRLGRRIGIGGVIPPVQARLLAETIEALLKRSQ